MHGVRKSRRIGKPGSMAHEWPTRGPAKTHEQPLGFRADIPETGIVTHASEKVKSTSHASDPVCKGRLRATDARTIRALERRSRPAGQAEELL